MKITIVVHEAQEGGYWAEVPAIPGCVSQGETLEELDQNIREAIIGCLSGESVGSTDDGFVRTLELAMSGRFRAESSQKFSSVVGGCCCASMEAITSMVEQVLQLKFPFRYMEIRL